MKFKKFILTLVILFCLASNLFALTTKEVLNYKGSKVVIVKNSNTTPYTITGIFLDVVTTNNGRDFVMLQTYAYQYYTDGIAFIMLDEIIKIREVI